MKKSNTRIIIYMSLFIALEVVLTRFLSIQTPVLRIGFAFLPVAISAMVLGPLYSGAAAALADILGMLLFSSGGAYFPGFTLTAFLSGATYGLFLFNRQKSFLRISIAVIIICLAVNLGLDTFWLWILTGKGYVALVLTRAIKCVVMIPIQIILIQTVWKYLGNQLIIIRKPDMKELKPL